MCGTNEDALGGTTMEVIEFIPLFTITQLKMNSL